MDFDTENGFSNLFGKEETERYPMIFSYTLNWRDKANRFSLNIFFFCFSSLKIWTIYSLMSEMEFWEGAATYNPLRCLLYYHFVFAFGFFLNKK